MKKESYLKRINFQAKPLPTVNHLRTLQEKHLLHIPFENWYIHDDIPISLEIPSLYKKVVEDKRGGFCYELNGLFYDLLNQIGFQSKLISAQVYSAGTDTFGEEFDHMAIITTIDSQDYLVDVGFGEFALHPLEITTEKALYDVRGEFIIKQKGKDFIVHQKKESNYQPVYLFNKEPRKFKDFTKKCHYHQTSSESHFTKKRLLSLATKDGRVTLSGNQLTIRKNGEITEKVVSEPFDSIIEHYFKPFPLSNSHRD